MKNIVIYVSVNVISEAKEKFIASLINIVSAAKQRPGCLTYQWLINPDDSNNFIIYGEFDSEYSFIEYKKSDVVLNIGKLLLPLLKEKPIYKHYRAQLFERN